MFILELSAFLSPHIDPGINVKSKIWNMLSQKSKKPGNGKHCWIFIYYYLYIFVTFNLIRSEFIHII